MTNQFLKPIKTFLEITRKNLKWAASEIQHQYFLFTLRDIEKKYPDKMKVEVNAFIEHLDAIFYGITEGWTAPDFVEPPEFETETETDAFKFVETKQSISNNGLNEPSYPHNTKQST